MKRIIAALFCLLSWQSYALAASRFWVGGTGTWDNATTTHWAATTGGAGGQSVPGVNDAVTIDGSSGAGTITVNTTVAVQSITCGAMGMTLDFSANNNNVTLTASNTAFTCSGTGTRSLNLGNGIWTLTGTGGIWTISITTNLTFNANSSIITFTATTASPRTMSAGVGLAYNVINVSANSSGGVFNFNQTTTMATFNVTAPNAIIVASGSTMTINNPFTWTGSSTNQIKIAAATLGTSANIAAAAVSTMSWAGLSDLTFTGSPTATNSFNLGNNSGITITAPVTTGGGGIIGG